MESMNGKVVVAVPVAPPPPPPPPPTSSCNISPLQERISKVLSEWTALQMAVQNEWGGHDSIKKSHQLASDILSWLFHCKALVQVFDLENLLHERLLLTFNTEIEDGSIEEVAEELMIIRDEYLQGHIVSVNSIQSNDPSFLLLITLNHFVKCCNGKAEKIVFL
ncbi:hypothetical protein Pfo_016059 [Paulownia fortunei]|nr:hypothetical protein Pfo_016059 [Paulownia fortunei]